MLAALFNPDHRRRRLAHRLPEGPLRAFLNTPFPAPRSDCREVEFVALDLETTGLDPDKDQIVSVGLVRLHGLRIDLATTRHCLVAPTRDIPEASAVVHHITDDRAATGRPLEEMLSELLPLLAGRVLVAHYARIELAFLSAACERLFGGKLLIPTVDTYYIARRWLERRDRAFSPKALRLSALRKRYNLPRYRAHNALSDALAAAELFIAQLAERDMGKPLPLKDFLFKP